MYSYITDFYINIQLYDELISQDMHECFMIGIRYGTNVSLKKG